MTKNQSLSLFNALHALNGLTGVKFSYAVAKNIDLLKPEVNALQKSIDIPEEYEICEEKRKEIVRRLTTQDETGKDLPVNETVFQKEWDSVKKKYPDLITKRERQIKEFNDLLETPSAITLLKVKLDDVPENITTGQMTSIYLMIEE